MLPHLDREATLDEINSIYESISPFIHCSPILQSSYFNQLTKASLFFKCENFQKTGSFKIRGALSAVATLDEDDKAKGLITHSSGNHGQALAYAASLHGINAEIVMPKNAPQIKQEAIRSYGATIHFCEASTESREKAVEDRIQKNASYLVHPYNDYNVIAGQASVCKEILDEIKDIDIIFAPIGGGGLISGTALYAHSINPKIKLMGAEPKNVDEAFRSIQAKKLLKNKSTKTIADGLRANIAEKTFSIIQQHVSEIIRLSEEEIVRAMKLVWERMKILIEPSSALPLAAILQNPRAYQNKRIAIILTGGNVDLNRLHYFQEHS